MPSGLSQSHQEIAGQFQWELLQLICLGSGGQHVQRPPPRGMGRPIGLQCPCNSFTRQEVRGASDSTNQRIENSAWGHARVGAGAEYSSIGAWRDFNAYIVARLPYINPSPGAEAILLEQRARADTDWAEKLAAKQREKLRVEGEGLASSARAGRGTAVEDAVSRRLNPMARKGGVAEAAEAAMRAAKRAPEQAWTRKGKEEMRRQAQERKAMATEEKAARKAAVRERKATKEREATRAAKAEAAETRARDREATKRAKAKMRAEARTKAAEAKATARAEAKEAKEAKEAAAKAAKAEAKAAKTAQQAAAKKAKAKARNKQAEAEEARATEQTQVEVAGSSGRGTETGEVHVYTGRARRASRRATGVG